MSAGPSLSERAYWDAAADTYDKNFACTLIGQSRREAVWRDLDRIFRAGDRVLELNCGTGIDALRLASHGIAVVACDLSGRMISLARERAAAGNFPGRVDFRVVANEEIRVLQPEGPFDGAFSNFSGLNCVRDLGAVARDLERLLRPGAPLLLCMIGRFVPWEIVWFTAHGDFHRALARRRDGTARHVHGGTLEVHYPPVARIVQAFAPGFQLRGRKGIGIMVPPSYMEHWARRFPRVTRALAIADRYLGVLPVFRSMADCVVLELERKDGATPASC